jgi:hypothetical protein
MSSSAASASASASASAVRIPPSSTIAHPLMTGLAERASQIFDVMLERMLEYKIGSTTYQLGEDPKNELLKIELDTLIKNKESFREQMKKHLVGIALQNVSKVIDHTKYVDQYLIAVVRTYIAMSPTFNSMYLDQTSTEHFLRIYNENFDVPPFGNPNTSDIKENELYKTYLFNVDNYSLKLGDLVPLLTWRLIMSAEPEMPPVKPRETAGHKGGRKNKKTQNIKNTKKGKRNNKSKSKSKSKSKRI